MRDSIDATPQVDLRSFFWLVSADGGLRVKDAGSDTARHEEQALRIP